MRHHGSEKILYARRLQAVEMVNQGISLKNVARRLRVSFSSVFRWKEAYLRAGKEGLAPKSVPGRPSKLGKSERTHLLEILQKGAVAYGYSSKSWTLKRVARVIRNEFDVNYHPNHISKILKSCGWFCVVLERRAK